MKLENLKLYELAQHIRSDWKKPNFAVVPFIGAMSQLDTIDENYMADSGRSIVTYFLSNASAWRGPVAKEVKKELKRRLK